MLRGMRKASRKISMMFLPTYTWWITLDLFRDMHTWSYFSLVNVIGCRTKCFDSIRTKAYYIFIGKIRPTYNAYSIYNPNLLKFEVEKKTGIGLRLRCANESVNVNVCTRKRDMEENKYSDRMVGIVASLVFNYVWPTDQPFSKQTYIHDGS